MSNCPYKSGKDYFRYRRKVVSGFIGWLFEYKCQDCQEENPTKTLDCHHLDPTTKVEAISQIVKSGNYKKALTDT